MKFYTSLALVGLAAAEPATMEVKLFGSMGLNVMYETMDGELHLTSQIRPLNNLVTNKTAAGIMQLITSRYLTDEEEAAIERGEKPESDPPASTGYVQTYSETAGVSANVFE